MFNFKIMFVLMGSLFWIQLGNAQIKDGIEVADSIPGNIQQEKFEQLLFNAISQRGIEEFEKAIQTLSQIETNVKDEVVVYFQLGLNYFDIEDYNSSLINLNLARTLKPGDQDITRAIFKVYDKQNKYQSAIDEALVLVVANNEYLEVLADLYFKSRNYEKAFEYLELSDKAFGYTANRDNKRELLFRSTKRFDLAISYYTERQALEPYNPFNYYRLASFYAEKVLYTKAIDATKNLLNDHPYFTRAYVLQTDFYVKNNQPERALEALRQVVKDRLLEEKYKIEAIEYFKVYLEQNPEYQQQFIDVLNTATQTAEDNASYLDLAEFYFETDKAKSLENYYKALEQNPQNYKILSAISVLNYQLEDFDEGVKIADIALEVFPSQALFMLYKGKSLFKLKQYNKANQVLLEGLDYMYEENEMMLEFYLSLSSSYQALGEASNALEFKNKAEKLKSQLE